MDIRQSDLGLLLALDALLAERNVTRAAERMNISQPAMSAQLARLRDLFDDPLLVSSGRHMMPTARALEIREPLHEALEKLSQLVIEQKPFDPSKSKRLFRIIAPDYLHSVVTLPLVRAAQTVAPGIQLALLPFDLTTAWSMMESLEADLLIAWKEVTPPEARAKRIFDERLCCVQRKDHPRGRKKLTIDAFSKLKYFVISPEGGALRGNIDDELEKHGRSRHVVASVPSFLAAPSLIAQTDLVTLMPYRLAKLMQDDVDIFEIPLPSTTYEVLASWHSRLHNDAGHQWLRELVAQSLISS